jgi:hypothetical protein
MMAFGNGSGVIRSNPVALRKFRNGWCKSTLSEALLRGIFFARAEPGTDAIGLHSHCGLNAQA